MHEMLTRTVNAISLSRFLLCSVPLTGTSKRSGTLTRASAHHQITTPGLFTGFGTALHRDRCATAIYEFQLSGQLDCHLRNLYRDTQFTNHHTP
jgi:hypothetical protein